eukprot:TRINITY_DN3043_c0_g1_i4.p1 TRINITY_DN3043_c0_g1~~TRINITY_DN3043_c0_g1_i4.p1  ORF type:complete len:216 (+),score=44.14 TRINITY_DN3043_c0_g1_i4:285-932(+)
MDSSAVLEVTVEGCSKLRKRRSQFVKPEPYVSLDYLGVQFRTTTAHKGTDPIYNQKFHFRLIEGADQLDVQVFCKHSVTSDSLLGSGRVYLWRVLNGGADCRAWPIIDKHNRFAGEVKLRMVLLSHQEDERAPEMEQSAASLETKLLNSCGEENGEGCWVLERILRQFAEGLSVESLLEKAGLFVFNKATELNPSSNFSAMSLILAILTYLFWHS